ncbi:MAG: DUF1553 domain-containing protein [Verrucomicrobiales bacterium]|nr:DUF1553 domain-containing protein [Verrucomicrobiales bacterium]
MFRLGKITVFSIVTAVPVVASDDFFREKIEPLLKGNCFECHSHEGGKTKGGLALDSKSGWEVGGESGPAIIPGDPENSLLIQAIRHEHEDLKMPGKSEKLPASSIALFEKWVRDGASDPRVTDIAQSGMQERIGNAQRDHWSFQPFTEPEPPAVEGATHPIDRFVRHRLKAEGLSASPMADPRTLVRRVYFDLIGLPPTFETVRKFENNPTPEAFEKMIDDLLARPEYGQRWARHWLDVARYADTIEQSVDGERRIPFAHTYRDYVVDALNDDKPFDRFIVEQIAGDLVQPELSPADLRGLGIYHVGRRFFANADGPVLRVDDRIDVIGRGFLGLTLACARCHDHKFDPVPTADYYSLYGILASFEEPLDWPEVSRSGDEKVVAEYLKKRTAKLAEYEKHVDACFVASKQHFRDFVTEYLRVVVRRSKNHRTTVGAIPLDSPRGLLFYFGPHRWEALLEKSRENGEPFFALWHRLIDLPHENFASRAGAIIQSETHPIVSAAFSERNPSTMLEVAEIYGDIIKESLAHAEKSQQAKAIVDLVYGPESPVPPASRDEVRDDLHRFLTEKRVTERKQGEKAKAIRTQLFVLEATGPVDRAMIIKGSGKPVDPVIFQRGNPKSPGEAVPRRFLQVLDFVDPDKYTTDGRIELARAIASPENPLTARVIVNRIWQQHFGRGLVATSDDFGLTGQPPSHPELLDFLATRFIESGWSIKSLHRLILTSQTWQQAGIRIESAMKLDSENRLLWRMPPRRLEFEPLRDSLLFVAGRLDWRLGGRGKLLDDKHNRRALYGYTDRYRIPALLRNFDVANPDTSISRRSETTVPLQSLYLMNSPFVRKQAEAVLENRKEFVDAESIEGRVDALFQIAFARNPDPEDREAAIELVCGADFRRESK